MIEYDLYKRILSLVEGPASTLELKDEHWITVHGTDDAIDVDSGVSYCPECCEKEVARLKKEDPAHADNYYVDGGWGIEGDYIPYCETCGAMLSNSLLPTFCEEQLEYFDENEFDVTSPDDCYTMQQMLESWGDEKVGPDIRALAKKIIEAKQ